jgi:hypothetical protein
METLPPAQGRGPQHSRDDPAKWQAIYYALETWPRTFRLSLIILVMAVSSTGAAIVIDLTVKAIIR